MLRTTRAGTPTARLFGAHVTVVDGASVGDHCVVGAGAVVTKPLPPNSLAVGVPARVVRSI